MTAIAGKVPVTVLTGFLRWGKTTLLNQLLAQAEGVAVIVNEFGEVGIDGQLVVGVDEDVVEINNGCICCTVRADLVTTIGRLLARPQPVQRILIETTDLADPAPLIQSFMRDEHLRERTETRRARDRRRCPPQPALAAVRLSDGRPELPRPALRPCQGHRPRCAR